MPTDLWLPDDVSQDQARPLEPGDPMVCHVFRNQLKSVDPARLDMIRSAPRAVDLPADRWLIVYRSEDAHVSWLLIQDEDGRDCVPDERHWDRLMEFDQARAQGRMLDAFRKRRDLIQAAAKQEKEDKRAEFREGLADRFSHILDPKVAISERAKELLDNAGVSTKPRRELPNHTLPKLSRREYVR